MDVVGIGHWTPSMEWIVWADISSSTCADTVGLPSYPGLHQPAFIACSTTFPLARSRYVTHTELGGLGMGLQQVQDLAIASSGGVHEWARF